MPKSKVQSTKESIALDIIKDISEKLSNFKNKASEIGLGVDSIKECQEDIDYMLSLLTSFNS